MMLKMSEEWLRKAVVTEDEALRQAVEYAKDTTHRHRKTFVVFQNSIGYGHMALSDWKRCVKYKIVETGGYVGYVRVTAKGKVLPLDKG